MNPSEMPSFVSIPILAEATSELLYLHLSIDLFQMADRFCREGRWSYEADRMAVVHRDLGIPLTAVLGIPSSVLFAVRGQTLEMLDMISPLELDRESMD